MTQAPKLGMQLYSARKFPPLERRLAVLSEQGFDAVETWGPLHDNAAATRRLLDAHGLKAASAHIEVETILSDPARALAIVNALGADTIVAPHLDAAARPATPEGWDQFGAQLRSAGEKLAAAGARLLWHNHDFEFRPLSDGSLPIEHLIVGPVQWEPDFAWALRAGADIKVWLQRFAGRMPIVHVKDIARANENKAEDGWADIGEGVAPWPSLWGQCVAAGAETMVAEHDNPSDFERFARSAAAAMRRYRSEVRP